MERGATFSNEPEGEAVATSRGTRARDAATAREDHRRVVDRIF